MLANNAAAMLRPGLVRSCGVQPILLRAATCPYSTSAAAPLISVRTKAVVSRKPLAARVAKLSTGPGPVTLSLAARRSASTTTAQKDAAASATASAQAQAAHPEVPPLDWNTFFQLRKTRRRWQLAFSIATCATGGLLGALALSTGVADPIVNQIPLDPFVTLGIMTFGFAALGWLAGPSLGSGVFYALKRQYKAQMILKESQFFTRIKKNRVDPRGASGANPVPDFYGEKISSVKGYRQWLRDQRAFNKKRVTFVT